MGDAPLSSGLDSYVEYCAWDIKTGKRLETDDYPLTRTLRTGFAIAPVELRIRRFDGTEGFIMMSTAPLRGPDGSLTGAAGINVDISTLKKAEATLRTSQEDLDRAQAVGQIGWWRLDTRRNELTWSDENHRIFGVPKGTPLTFETFLATVHPDDRQYVDTQWQAGVRGEPYDIEHRIVADGKVKWVREKAYLELDATGTLLGGFGITQDITARKEAEEKLTYLASFPRLNPHPVVEIDFAGGAVQFANATAQRLFPDLTERGEAHPWLAGTRELARTLRSGAEPQVREVTVGGAYYHQTVTITPDRQRARVYGIDITARKKVEQALRESEAQAKVATAVRIERQRLQEVLNMLPAYVILLTRDYHVPMANRFFEERFGKAGGRRCFEYLFNRREPCENCETYRVLKTNAPHRWEWTGPDGRNYDVYDFPFTDVDGSSLVMEVGLDITERKRAEQEQRLLRDELARFSRITTAGQLTAALAHELNQPLGAIVCNVQAVQNLLAQGGADPSEVREILKDIEADGKRAGTIIHQLRKLFQKTGRSRTMLRLNELLRRTLELLRNELVLRDVAVRLDLEPGLPAIRGNEVELQQVVLNLVTNAADAVAAREPGARQLVIRTAADGPGSIRVSVRDSGLGLSGEQLERLFEPFYTTKVHGMGMGLAISQSIVEAHEGRLWGENNREGGATFHFTLPVNSRQTV